VNNVAQGKTGPGIAKVRQVEVVSRRSLALIVLRDGWWSRLLERADLVSEGAVVDEEGRRVYYGSTSLHAQIERTTLEALPHPSVEQLAMVVLADPHARLRLLRLAHREAASRADGTLDVLSAELRAEVVLRGGQPWLSISIDVGAPLVDAAADAG